MIKKSSGVSRIKKDKSKGRRDKNIPKQSHGFGDFDLALTFRTMLTKIPFNSPVSCLSATNFCSGTNSDSPNSSNQYSLSSSSWSEPSILLMKSGFDLARDASRYCAPTEGAAAEQLPADDLGFRSFR
jgi:hypothetical protein